MGGKYNKNSNRETIKLLKQARILKILVKLGADIWQKYSFPLDSPPIKRNAIELLFKYYRVNNEPKIIEFLTNMDNDPIKKAKLGPHLLTQHQQIKRAAHKIGSIKDQNIPIYNDKNEIVSTINVLGSGDYPINSLIRLNRDLIFFKNKINLDNSIPTSLKEDLDKIIIAYEIAEEMEPKVFSDVVDILLKKYKDNELVVIPSGWMKHTVGLALYKNKLILCNSGERPTNQYSGVYIYDVNGIVDKSTLNGLRFSKDIESYYQNLLTVTGPEDNSLKHFLPAKDQSRGNCSFANPKTLIKGILSVFQSERNTYISNSSLSLSASPKKDYLITYKMITKAIRDAEENFIKENIRKAKIGGNTGKLKFLKELHAKVEDYKEKKSNNENSSSNDITSDDSHDFSSDDNSFSNSDDYSSDDPYSFIPKK
ncbi:MAG: hypothetical protein JWM09_1064 [Francisellaceae bacterium]|nr:hypothetical protein [Francisellaceae bacterium]